MEADVAFPPCLGTAGQPGKHIRDLALRIALWLALWRASQRVAAVSLVGPDEAKDDVGRDGLDASLGRGLDAKSKAGGGMVVGGLVVGGGDRLEVGRELEAHCAVETLGPYAELHPVLAAREDAEVGLHPWDEHPAIARRLAQRDSEHRAGLREHRSSLVIGEHQASS